MCTVVTVSSTRHTREQEMPRLLISNRSALLILNAAISASAARIVRQQVSCKTRRAAEGAGSGPPERADRLKVFTSNRKRLSVAECFGQMRKG
jgi:hypothetical protein